MPTEGVDYQEQFQLLGTEAPVDVPSPNTGNISSNHNRSNETPTGYDLPFSGSNSLGYKSNGRYVPWLVRRALKQLGGESLCRLEVVTSCSGIIEVVLSRRNLDSVPPEVFDFLSLETLRLDNNNLQLLDAHVGRLRSLKYLLLGKNQLSTLPASLANCRHLAELDVQCNRLASVPASVWRLKRLSGLNLSWNQLTSIPADISRLKELRMLDLEGNILSDCGSSNDNINAPSSLPTEMVLLEHLHVLNIGENGMVSLPPIICRLQTLRALNLAGNKLVDLPPSFVRLEYLSELSLAGNHLVSVPACLSELKSLRYLNLSRNVLRVLPASLAQLDRLQILLAAGNNLIAISDSLSQNLQVLDVSQNKLRNLCVGKLKNLSDLNVSNNRLEVLPMGIGVSKGSKRIVRLLAACNRITRVNAEEIMSLSRLQHFDLSGNSIATMSAELLRFLTKRLKEYCLQGNPIAASQSIFPMCRHMNSKSAKDGVDKHQHLIQRQAHSTINTTNNVKITVSNEVNSRQLGSSTRPSSSSHRSASHQSKQQQHPITNEIEAEVCFNMAKETFTAPTDVQYSSSTDDSSIAEVTTQQIPPVSKENTSCNVASSTSNFPPPPPSILAANSKDADYSTNLIGESQPAAVGLLATVPQAPPLPPPIETPAKKFSQVTSPNITREKRRQAGVFSPTETRLTDAVTRVLRVGSAGGAFSIDFGTSSQQPVRSASPVPTSSQQTPATNSPHNVKIFVPPQALAHSSNLVVKFLYVDDVGLAGLADEKMASHVVSFSPIVFMKASPSLSATSPTNVANRQASTPLTTRLYEDLTVTINVSPQAEAAIARRACTLHVVDIIVVAGSVLESPETMARIVCAPHPRARMSSTGQQVFVKFGHLGNGIGVIVSKSSNRRKVCRAAEQLIHSELSRRSANNVANEPASIGL